MNGEVLIEKMDVLKNGQGGVEALPGGGLGDSSRVFACTDEEKALNALVRCPYMRYCRSGGAGNTAHSLPGHLFSAFSNRAEGVGRHQARTLKTNRERI